VPLPKDDKGIKDWLLAIFSVIPKKYPKLKGQFREVCKETYHDVFEEKEKVYTMENLNELFESEEAKTQEIRTLMMTQVNRTVAQFWKLSNKADEEIKSIQDILA